MKRAPAATVARRLLGASLGFAGTEESFELPFKGVKTRKKEASERASESLLACQLAGAAANVQLRRPPTQLTRAAHDNSIRVDRRVELVVVLVLERMTCACTSDGPSKPSRADVAAAAANRLAARLRAGLLIEAAPADQLGADKFQLFCGCGARMRNGADNDDSGGAAQVDFCSFCAQVVAAQSIAARRILFARRALQEAPGATLSRTPPTLIQFANEPQRRTLCGRKRRVAAANRLSWPSCGALLAANNVWRPK